MKSRQTTSNTTEYDDMNSGITLPADRSPTRLESKQGASTIRAKPQDGKLAITSQTQNALQKMVYRITEKGALLNLDISILSGSLRKPFEYQSTYQRDSKK
jgi:hypothetical protein